MPRPRKTNQPPARTPLLNTRLSAADYIKLEQVCRAEGKTKTELLREALLQYLDRYDQDVEAAARDRLTETLVAIEASRRKDTERLAKLIARTLMDVGILNQVLFRRAAADERDKLWEAARQAAAERLKHKRKGGDAEATEIMKNALSSEA